MNQFILIFTGLVILTIIYGIYKSFKKLNTMCDENWGKIQFQMNTRYDYISSLINQITTKFDNENETEKLNNLIDTRLKTMQAFTPFEKSLTEKNMDTALKEVLELTEENEILMKDNKLQETKKNLSNISDELIVSSIYYNAVVRDLNSKISSFPSSIVASMFGIHRTEPFAYDFINQNIKSRGRLN